MRLSALIPLSLGLCLATAPAAAQAAPDPVPAALAEIEAHRVNLRVGCGVPVPALWNAPPWEQRAAADRRAAFQDCLSGVMQREQERLGQLERRIASRHSAAPDADWSAAERALDAKWSELEALSSKLRTRENWANTAVQVLDTFTGPGAPFDTTPRSAYNRCAPYRCDSSTFAPGIR
jgi:hypothetical protein